MDQETGKTIQTQLAVIGGGPAGLAAAISAAELGVRCVLVERYDRLGGQISAVHAAQAVHAAHKNERFSEPEIEAVRGYRARLEGLEVQVMREAHLWTVTKDRQLIVFGREGAIQIQFETLVVATGAHERPLPFKGWTLPGVMTTGAAQRLLAADVLPGQRVLAAGRGPLLLKCAAQLAASGVEVAAMVEVTPFPHLLKNGFGKLTHIGNKYRQALDYLRALRRMKVPLLFGQALIEASGAEAVEAAVTAPLDASGEPVLGQRRTWQVDAICISNGLEPDNRICRLAGCKLVYDPLTESYRPEHDHRMRTSLGWLLVAGEAAGIGGAAKALVEGQIAGLQAAIELGAAKEEALYQTLTELEEQRQKTVEQYTAIESAYVRASRLWEIAGPEATICRCEGVSRAELQQAIRSGSRSLRDIKNQTRIGMGLCQGHFCETTLRHEFTRMTGRHIGPDELPSVRPPLEPVPLSMLVE